MANNIAAFTLGVKKSKNLRLLETAAGVLSFVREIADTNLCDEDGHGGLAFKWHEEACTLIEELKDVGWPVRVHAE